MFLVKSRFLKLIFFLLVRVSSIHSCGVACLSGYALVSRGGFEGRWICYDKSNDDFLGLAGGNKVERENGSKGAGGIKKKVVLFFIFYFSSFLCTYIQFHIPPFPLPLSPAPESEGINTPWPNHPISSLTTGSPSMWVLFYYWLHISTEHFVFPRL